MSENESGGQEPPERLADRTERALQQKISVLPTDTQGQYEAVSQSGATYAVDLVADRCNCPDMIHRAPSGGCKHLRRARYAVGADPIPSQADLNRVDDQLGLHVDDKPVVEPASDRVVVADGGVSAGTTPADASPQTRREDDETDADAGEEDDEGCWCNTRDTPYWDCWQAGNQQ
jgi:hypothetical protein